MSLGPPSVSTSSSSRGIAAAPSRLHRGRSARRSAHCRECPTSRTTLSTERVSTARSPTGTSFRIRVLSRARIPPTSRNRRSREPASPKRLVSHPFPVERRVYKTGHSPPPRPVGDGGPPDLQARHRRIALFVLFVIKIPLRLDPPPRLVPGCPVSLSCQCSKFRAARRWRCVVCGPSAGTEEAGKGRGTIPHRRVGVYAWCIAPCSYNCSRRRAREARLPARRYD